MADIIFKSNKGPREYDIPSRETIRGPILYTGYATMREIHTKNILNKAEVSVLSGSVYGSTVNKNPLMNSIAHETHYPVAVCDIFVCTGHM